LTGTGDASDRSSFVPGPSSFVTLLPPLGLHPRCGPSLPADPAPPGGVA